MKNLLFEATKQIKKTKATIAKKKIALIGFSGEMIWTTSEVTLPVYAEGMN